MIGKQQLANEYGISLRTFNRVCVAHGFWEKGNTKKMVALELVEKIRLALGEGKMVYKNELIQKTRVSVTTFRRHAKNLLGYEHKNQYLTPIEVQRLSDYFGVYE